VRALFPLLLCAAASARAATVAIDVGHFIEEPGATSARGRPELDFNAISPRRSNPPRDGTD